jgi:hypothetical protein
MDNWWYSIGLKDAQKNGQGCTDYCAGGKNCWTLNMRLDITTPVEKLKCEIHSRYSKFG